MASRACTRGRVLVALVLGVLSTVAVSWGIAAWADMSTAPQAHYTRAFIGGERLWGCSGWFLVVLDRPGSRRVIMTPWARSWWLSVPDSVLPAEVRHALDSAEEGGRASGAPKPGWMVWDARGWPFLAMTCEWPWWGWGKGAYPPVRRAITLPRHDLTAGFRQGAIRALPLSPRLGPFLANTGIYAAAWFALLSLPAAARRLRLLVMGRPGYCRRCGYNLAGLPRDAPCPECGRRLEACDREPAT